MELITIAAFDLADQAEPLKQRLERAGIASLVHDGSTMARLWFVREPVAAVKLKVPAGDFENALWLIRRWEDSETVLKDAIRCPECKSSRVEYPQLTRKFLLPNLIGLLAPLGIVEKKFYCQDCQCTWSKDGKKTRVRAHMAPHYFIEGLSDGDANKGAAH